MQEPEVAVSAPFHAFEFISAEAGLRCKNEHEGNQDIK